VTFRQASFIEASITTLQGKLIGASIFVAVILFFFLGTAAADHHRADGHSGVDLHHRAGLQVLRPVDQHHDAGRPGHRHRRPGRRRGGGCGERAAPAEGGPREPSATPAAPDRVVAHATMEVRSAILYATVIIVLVFIPLFALPGLEGQAVRAAGHRLHRVDAGLADRVGDGDAGAQLLPAAAHEEPGPWRHQGPGLAQGALPQQPAARADRPEGGHGGGRCWRCWWPRPPCRSSRRPSCRPSTRARC
jgi:hypothetical protein